MGTAAVEKTFFLTSIGKKYVMGLTGLIWAGFVAGHMAGNMLMFVGPDAYNSYGHALTSGYLIYAIETLLILALATHIACAVSLTLENRRARGGQRYAVTPNGTKAPRFASQTMAIQGSIILVFIILHIATFKYGTYYETTANGVVMRDLHRLLVEVFHNPGYVAWYLVAMVFLFMHLSHGVGSIFQSFGIKNQKNEHMIRVISFVYGAVVAGGFFAQPIYCFVWGQ